MVYKAEDTTPGRLVVLKFLPDEFSGGPQKHCIEGNAIKTSQGLDLAIEIKGNEAPML